MENLKNSMVWSLNTTVWKWELESYLENTIEEDGFMEDLIILGLIVGVILILIFLLAIQISRSYFRSSRSIPVMSTTSTNKSTDQRSDNSPEPSHVVLDIDMTRTEDPPRYSQLFS